MAMEPVAPINHGTVSAAANTTAGAAWGGFKWGAIVAAAWVIGLTALGAWFGASAIASIFASPAVAAVAATATTAGTEAIAAVSGYGLWSTLAGIVTGGLGLIVGTATSWIPGGTAAVVGAAKGGADASQRVSMERARAMEQYAEIAMAQPQPRFQADPRFNLAASGVDASTADYQGRMNAMGLQRGA